MLTLAIAKEYGVTLGCVKKQRRERGIAPFTKTHPNAVRKVLMSSPINPWDLQGTSLDDGGRWMDE